MKHSAELRKYLESCDIEGVRRLWKNVSPHLPGPTSDALTLVAIHHARTQTNSIALKHRAYSHRWLLDAGYPSGLPDALKSRAERMYPRVVEGVGVSVNSTSPILRPVAVRIEKVMSDVVEEMFAEGDREPTLVKSRMLAAKNRELKKLLGKIAIEV